MGLTYRLMIDTLFTNKTNNVFFRLNSVEYAFYVEDNVEWFSVYEGKGLFQYHLYINEDEAKESKIHYPVFKILKQIYYATDWQSIETLIKMSNNDYVEITKQ